MRTSYIKISRRILLTSITFNLFVVMIFSQSIEIFYDTSYPRQVGGSFPLGVRYTDHKGKIRMTRGFLGGKQLWVYYYINVMGGAFSNGKIQIANSPEAITDHKILVSAHLMSDLKIFNQIVIPMTYTGLTIADYTPHEDFKYGRDGDILNVYISKYYDSVYCGELLKVKIYSLIKNNVSVYYLHPEEGQIHIIANGGYGEDGAFAVSGADGGDGGDGGTINVYILENARDCVAQIKISNYGGSGGRGNKGDEVSGRNGINGINGPTPRIEIVDKILR